MTCNCRSKPEMLLKSSAYESYEETNERDRVNNVIRHRPAGLLGRNKKANKRRRIKLSPRDPVMAGLVRLGIL